MKSIIIDDETMARAIIDQLCQQTDDIEVVAQFDNAIEAIKYINKNEVDVIFLDIHMPTFSGFDFLDTVTKDLQVILTTSDPKFAIEAFEYPRIKDYLVKPVTLPRFLKMVEKLKKQPEKSNAPAPVAQKDLSANQGKELYINIDRRLIKIAFDQIFLIEAKGDYILIKTHDKNYTVHSTLKKIEDKLPQSQFIKVHRSYVINFTKIVDIEDNSVLIERDVIPISRSNRPELMKRLNLL
ncbi:LytTR family DNA-binding domain-containing protein [Gilvibacter sp.]|uniref:LytR/AlgR family response regulator transcription factor n=1 Tax=Gilvibacter sp. TaxID=2729997 RepID=UPI0025BAFFF1|nr:LytTR family DNA-binding domain-containing protein [Gilvibacter sp.]NQX78002.1 response regulator transcription factor [Gilvibacter sp.]